MTQNPHTIPTLFHRKDDANMQKIRVVMAEDHHVVRRAVADFLTKEPDIEVVGEVAETTTLPDTVSRLKPNLLLLDANMPGPNVIEITKTLRAQHPDVYILVLSAYDRREHVVGLLRAGASGYVLKDDEPEELVEAVRMVAQGEEWLSSRVTRILLRSMRDEGIGHAIKLTRRERDVLELMVTGATNDEIAATLTITTNTVKNHVRSIFRKMDVKSRTEAVVYAINHHLVEAPATTQE